MNIITRKTNSGIRGEFSLQGLNLNDPCERVLYENRRLETIAGAQPRDKVKVVRRRRNCAVSTAEKRCLWGLS